MPERDDTEDLPLGEQIDILLEELPPPVQKFLTGPERNAVSLELSRKYRLHTDTAGVFERAYIYMLLGVYTPDEFVQELREGGIDEETIRGLAADVNEQVFKKLREEERTGTPAPVAPVQPQVPVMEIGKSEVPSNLPGQDIQPQPPPIQVPPPPAPAYVAPQPPITSPPPAPEPVPIVPIIPPPQTYTPPPAYVPPSQPPAPTPIYSAPLPPAPVETHQPIARTMERDMELAEQGYRTQPAPYAPPPIQAPPPVPQPPVQAAPPPAPTYPPPVLAPVRLTPVGRTHADAPITKEYGSDPYREPIE